MPIFAGMLMGEKEQSAPFMNRYQVNVLIDNGEQAGAPVVEVDNPTFQNLVGTVEHQVQFGALITDFTMIRPGALHRANGGYLVLDARKLLLQPYAYDGLKRMLRSREVTIESLGQALSLVSTVSLEPESIPLDVKVVLVGERYLYYLLCQYDEEFNDLFKVAADFDDQMDRLPDNTRQFAAFLATFARNEGLRPLDASGVGRVVEYASRMVSDVEKLSTRRAERHRCPRAAPRPNPRTLSGNNPARHPAGQHSRFRNRPDQRPLGSAAWRACLRAPDPNHGPGAYGPRRSGGHRA